MLFQISKKTCSELNSLVSNFLWGKGDKGNKIHWVAWTKLSSSKKVGGLGFRDFSCFKLALLAKQAWRVLSSPNDPWFRILKGTYFLTIASLMLERVQEPLGLGLAS